MADNLIETLLFPLGQVNSLVLQASVAREVKGAYAFAVRSGVVNCQLGIQWFRDSGLGRDTFVTEVIEPARYEPFASNAISFNVPVQRTHRVQWLKITRLHFSFAPASFGEAMLSLTVDTPTQTGLQCLMSEVAGQFGVNPDTLYRDLLPLFIQRYASGDAP